MSERELIEGFFLGQTLNDTWDADGKASTGSGALSSDVKLGIAMGLASMGRRYRAYAAREYDPDDPDSWGGSGGAGGGGTVKPGGSFSTSLHATSATVENLAKMQKNDYIVDYSTGSGYVTYTLGNCTEYTYAGIHIYWYKPTASLSFESGSFHVSVSGYYTVTFPELFIGPDVRYSGSIPFRTRPSFVLYKELADGGWEAINVSAWTAGIPYGDAEVNNAEDGNTYRYAAFTTFVRLEAGTGYKYGISMYSYPPRIANRQDEYKGDPAICSFAGKITGSLDVAI